MSPAPARAVAADVVARLRRRGTAARREVATP